MAGAGSGMPELERASAASEVDDGAASALMAGGAGPMGGGPGSPGGQPMTIQIPMEEVKKWPVIYPVYLNAALTVAEGRRVPKDKCEGCEFVTWNSERAGWFRAALRVRVR